MNGGFLYILSNKNRTVLYIGATKDLKSRIKLHIKGEASIFTKKYNVYDLIYFEEFSNLSEAFRREKQ